MQTERRRGAPKRTTSHRPVSQSAADSPARADRQFSRIPQHKALRFSLSLSLPLRLVFPFSAPTPFSKSESHCKLRPNARKGLSPLLPQLSPPPASPPFVHPPTHPPPSRSSLPLPHPPRAPGWQFSGGTINGSPVLNQSPSCPSPSRPPERVLCNGQFTVSSLWVM